MHLIVTSSASKRAVTLNSSQRAVTPSWSKRSVTRKHFVTPKRARLVAAVLVGVVACTATAHAAPARTRHTNASAQRTHASAAHAHSHSAHAARRTKRMPVRLVSSALPPAVARLDQGATGTAAYAAPGAVQTMSAAAPAAPAAYDLYTLRAALPGLNGNPSTTAADLAATVTQALSTVAGDLHITVSSTTPQLIITGSPASVALARELLTRLDVPAKLVVLDTQILEVDESVAKDLGLSFPQPVVATTFSETVPPNDANGNPQRLAGLSAIGRTPLSLSLQLNLLIRNGSARVLANPRITTVSGRTATIRAGDTIAVETTAGGGAGTVATTQIQTFQTGVTLDITPIVNAEHDVSVTLHPAVNSETAIINGIPQIATRDTQTTVTLQEDQTLIIGGLIQESSGRTDTKIPVLGDLPLVGKVFRENQVNSTRNELVITVTPHVIAPGGAVPPPAAAPVIVPQTVPQALPAPARTAPPAVRAPAAQASPYPALNTFTYGSIPQNNFAKSTDPVQIFYTTFSPTVLGGNKVVLINAITSSNAQRVSLTYGTFTQQLAEVNRGQWQARFPLGASVLPPPPANVSLTLTAARSDGSSTSIPIPVSVAP